MLFKKLFKQYILKFSNNTKEMTKRSLVEMSMRGHWSYGSRVKYLVGQMGQSQSDPFLGLIKLQYHKV